MMPESSQGPKPMILAPSEPLNLPKKPWRLLQKDVLYMFSIHDLLQLCNNDIHGFESTDALFCLLGDQYKVKDWPLAFCQEPIALRCPRVEYMKRS